MLILIILISQGVQAVVFALAGRKCGKDCVRLHIERAKPVPSRRVGCDFGPKGVTKSPTVVRTPTPFLCPLNPPFNRLI